MKHDYPLKARYKRFDNRIYFVGDFEDNEEIEFAYMCEKPNACAIGNVWYKGKAGIPKLINIKELKEADYEKH
jgi:hypothetical protein